MCPGGFSSEPDVPFAIPGCLFIGPGPSRDQSLHPWNLNILGNPRPFVANCGSPDPWIQSLTAHVPGRLDGNSGPNQVGHTRVPRHRRCGLGTGLRIIAAVNRCVFMTTLFRDRGFDAFGGSPCVMRRLQKWMGIFTQRTNLWPIALSPIR